MTQAFCHLILHYSAASLSWRTIKSLRRSRRSRLRRNEKCRGGDNDGRNDESHQKSTETSSVTHHKDDDDVSPVEYAILQGWTILAFHSLYVSMGVEYFVRFVIPFYFHLKMIVLIATFVIPSWAGRRNGGGNGISEYGLSPVIGYWFDYLIVPGVHKMHELTDHDPKRWAVQQLAMVPFLVIDYFILPGLLTTEEEKQLVRERIREERTNEGEGDTPKLHPLEAFPPEITNADNTPVREGVGQPKQEKKRCEDEASVGEEGASKVPPSEAFPPQITNADNAPLGEHFDQPMSPGEQSSTSDKENCSQSTTKDEEHLRNISHIPDSRNELLEEFPAAEPDDSGSIQRTPPRGQKTSSLLNEGTPIRTKTPLWATPAREVPAALSSSKKSFNSFLSPTVKSRLASSAMRLRRVSRDHRKSGDLLSTTPRRGKEASETNEEQVSTAQATIKRIIETTPKEHPDENKAKTTARDRRRKRRERLSLGDHFRELVTGDANIRVRDHLFDLDLSATPRKVVHTQPSKDSGSTSRSNSSSKRRSGKSRDLDKQADPKGNEQVSSSNVTTRRSSRLANRKV